MKISGKAFLVTGGASGLGEATCRAIVKKGGFALIADLNADLGNALAKDLGEDKALFCSVDVSDEKQVQAAIDAAVKKWGSLWGVVQCAGVGNPMRVLSGNGQVHPLKVFKFVNDINLTGTFNVLRLSTAAMAKNQPDEDGEKGVIINTASVAAFEGQIGQCAYAASKGGVVAMTLPAARELAMYGIRVMTIAPGLFKTPMLAKLPEKAQKSLGAQVPFPKRLGQPEEFAGCATFIIENTYMNGNIVRIDGSIRMAAM